LDLQKQKINNLVLITDNSALRFISLAALHDGKQFLVEKYSVGVMPGLNLTDTRYKDLKNANILAMGISKPIYNFSALPSIEIELSNIKSVWKSNVDIFLNEEFTIDNFRLQRQNKNFQIIHIATHAGLNVRDFDELGLEQFPLELLVLSTGYSGIGTISKDTKFGFAGKAIQSGTKSVLASLTSVSDEGTTTLMTEFYKQLKTAPTKSEALRKAQVSMLKKSKNFSHPYYWASFTIIGNPW
jgi:CHAT domain-containing protein